MPDHFVQPNVHEQPAAVLLIPAQIQTAMALAYGATITEAADAIGVHRSTIYNWYKADPAFHTAVEEIRRERTERINDDMRELDTLALGYLRDILQNVNAPAGVRLRAASMVLNRPKSVNGDVWHMPHLEDLDRALTRRPVLAEPPTFDTIRQSSTDLASSAEPPQLTTRRNSTQSDTHTGLLQSVPDQPLPAMVDEASARLQGLRDLFFADRALLDHPPVRLGDIDCGGASAGA